MTNHPGRRKPTWVATAETLAASRVAAIQWPASDGVHVLTRDQLEQVIRDTTIWAYGEGLRAAVAAASGRKVRG